MSIQVRSNETKAPEPTEAKAPESGAKESGEATLSALDPKESEHKESETSEPSETEAKEEGETEESESHEDGEAQSKENKDEEKPKKKGGFQRRIDKLNARVSAKEQETEYWKQQALKGASESTKAPKVETSKPAAADGKPKADAFDTHSEYVEALTDWKTEQKLNERDQRLERSKLQIEQEKVVKSYNDRVKIFSEKTEDFQEVLAEVDDIPISPAIREILLTSENGPELAYELAKNREEYVRVCKLPPLAAAREMGKIEARMSPKTSEGTKQETKKITQAPKPLEPVKAGKGSASKSIFDPTLSQSEYEKLRREQMKRRQA